MLCFNIILGLDFIFLCFKPHYHTLQYPKTKEIILGQIQDFLMWGG